MFVLVINIALSLTSWILTIGHSSASTCIHHGREAPRQLRGYLQLIGIGYAGLWLTRRRRVKRASTVNCARTGRGIRLHFCAQIKLVSLNARHGGGRAGFCMTRGESVLILKVLYGSVESCHRWRMRQELARHEFCLNELTGKTSGWRKSRRSKASVPRMQSRADNVTGGGRRASGV
jgi:hypothetical protein